MNRTKNRGKVIRSGGFEVRVNTSHTGCRIVYYKLGKRVFERCSSEQHAEDRAREILAQYNSGVSLATLQSPHEMVKYERSLSMLGPLNVDIDQAVQPARKHENNRFGGTVYTSFINITDNKFFLSYKLSNKNVIKLDLTEDFAKSKRQKINLREISD